MESTVEPRLSTVNIGTSLTDVVKDRYNVEFFHIYTDEKIEDRHIQSIQHLKDLEEAWSFDHDRVIMIDDYNPKTHTLDRDDVLNFLTEQGVTPDFWVFESDMVGNAQYLLDMITNNKLRKSYRQYIEKNNKYPCSLLTASWYLTRLGRLNPSVLRATNAAQDFVPATRLFNLLPADYKSVEDRARRLILNSPYAADSDKIQHLFYAADAGRMVKLF